MVLLPYVRRLAEQPGVYWLVSDSKAEVGALRTYREGGHCGDGIHHPYATVLEGAPRIPSLGHKSGHHAAALDHGPQVDAATQEPLEVDLTWLLRRPFSFPPFGNLAGLMAAPPHNTE